MIEGPGSQWEVVYTPWWTRFGRIGTDGLTRMERSYIVREFKRKTRRKGRHDGR